MGLIVLVLKISRFTRDSEPIQDAVCRMNDTALASLDFASPYHCVCVKLDLPTAKRLAVAQFNKTHETSQTVCVDLGLTINHQ